MHKTFAPIPPGDGWREECLNPLGISQYRLAHDLDVHPRRINEIVHGTRAMSAETALRRSRYFRLAECFWLDRQTHDELEREKDRLGGRLEKEVLVLAREQASSMGV